MKIYIDRQKVNARAQAANLASVGGLILLLASVVIPLFLPKWSTVTTVLMIVGAIGAMVGIYLANRWVRKPRPEESLDKRLRLLTTIITSTTTRPRCRVSTSCLRRMA